MNGQVYRDSKLKINWTEENLLEADELAQEDHHDAAAREERLRYRNTLRSTQRHSDKDTSATETITRGSCQNSRVSEDSRSQRRGCHPQHSLERSCSPTKCSVAAAAQAATARNTTSKYERWETRRTCVSKWFEARLVVVIIIFQFVARVARLAFLVFFEEEEGGFDYARWRSSRARRGGVNSTPHLMHSWT